MSVEELAKHDIESYRSSETAHHAHTSDHVTAEEDTPEEDQTNSDQEEDDNVGAPADDDAHALPSPVETEMVKTKEQVTAKNETSEVKCGKPDDGNTGQEGDANMEKRGETTEATRYRWGRDSILSLPCFFSRSASRGTICNFKKKKLISLI